MYFVEKMLVIGAIRIDQFGVANGLRVSIP